MQRTRFLCSIKTLLQFNYHRVHSKAPFCLRVSFKTSFYPVALISPKKYSNHIEAPYKHRPPPLVKTENLHYTSDEVFEVDSMVLTITYGELATHPQQQIRFKND